MTKRVNYFGVTPDKGYGEHTSEREYDSYAVLATTEVAPSYGYPHTEARNIDLYIDAETGIVVSDVAKFEEWIKNRG